MRATILLICCFMGAQILLAQGRFSFGVSAQIGMTDGLKEPEVRASFSTGYYVEERGSSVVPVAGGGAWVNYQLNGKLSLQSGLQYLNMGNTYFRKGYSELIATNQRSYYESVYDFRADQLQLPLEVNISIGKGTIKPIFSFGAQLSYEWLGVIYHESPAFRDAQDRVIVSRWGNENRILSDYDHFSVQPVFGFGLRLNENMSIRLRRTWGGRNQEVSWQEKYFSPLEPNAPGVLIIIDDVPSWYSVPTSHHRFTTLEISYCLF